MARFRRRKPRVVWLPPSAVGRIGINPAVSGISPGAFQFVQDITGPSTAGTSVTSVFPVLSDLPSPAFQGSNLAVDSLADIYSSGYRLRRIVGKLYVGMGQTSPDVGQSSVAQVILCTAGFIVLRVKQDGTPIADSDPDSYSPSIINNWADPWIWRRTWILGSVDAATHPHIFTGGILWQENNCQYGSVADGPHIDQKTARRISTEERLFLVCTTTLLDTTTQEDGVVQSFWYGDLRCVASLITTAGNRRNASR